jgi:hypothetical protein
MIGQRFERAAAVALLLGTCASTPLDGEGQLSAQSASELVSLMKAKNLEAFAVKDVNADRFVAAMLVPGVQLLVVAGQTTSPDYVQSQLAAKRYDDVYRTLHSAVVPASKLFVQDMGCDGLSDGAGNVDIVYERGSVQTIFNGQWKQQKLSEAEYKQRLRTVDGEYGRMLGALAQALRTPPQ